MAARRGLLAATLLVASAAACEAQAGRALRLKAPLRDVESPQRAYQLPAQPLDQALRAVALAAGVDTLFAPDLMAGRR